MGTTIECLKLLTPAEKGEAADWALAYGQEYYASRLVIMRFRDEVEKARLVSAPEDLAIADSACTLLEDILPDDMRAHVLRDVNRLSALATEQRWSEKETLGQRQHLLNAYCLTAEAFARLVAESSYLHELPKPRLAAEGDRRLRVMISKLAMLDLTLDDGTAALRMDPVYDGGIDDVASPIKSVGINIKHGEPAQATVHISFGRLHDLADELGHHPEMIRFTKIELVRIFDLYRQDPVLFRDNRSSHRADYGSTIIWTNFFQFLEDDYLKKTLTPDQYADFQAASKLAGSNGIIAALRLRVVAEQVYDESSYLLRGWYKDNYPHLVAQVVLKTKEALKELGCEADDNVLANLPRIINLAARDMEYAKRVATEWETIFPAFAGSVSDSIKEEIDRFASLYRCDLEMDVLQRTLEMARGQIIIEANADSE